MKKSVKKLSQPPPPLGGVGGKVRAGRGIGTGNRLADAPGRAGDHRDFTGQIKVGEMAHCGS